MAQEDKNVPALVNIETFALQTPSTLKCDLNPALADAIEPGDFEGYAPTRAALPIASVRQKELVDPATGEVLVRPGKFKLYDPVTNEAGEFPPDVAALTFTCLTDMPSQVYFPEGVFDKPACRAIDGVTGIGTPGGKCATCPLAQFKPDGKRPDCSAQMNLLIYDHALGSCYILRWGRSALKPWDLFKEGLKRTKQPLATFILKASLKYEAEPQPHYVPILENLGQIPLVQFVEFKQTRAEYTDVVERTAEVHIPDDEHPANSMPTGDPGGSLPPGVQPVTDPRIPGHTQVAKDMGSGPVNERENKDGKGLPF